MRGSERGGSGGGILKFGFNEEFVSERQDTLDGKCLDFDFDEIDRRLQGLPDAPTEADLQVAATALMELLRWCVVKEDGTLFGQRMTYRRAVALLWVIRPDAFSDTPSLARLAKRICVNKVALSIHSAAAHRDFVIRNRAQSHASNFNPNKDGALPAHHDETEESNE